MIEKIKSTEKAVRIIESENTLVFETSMKTSKPEIKKEVEALFNVKVDFIFSII